VITVIVFDPALPAGPGNLAGTICFDVATANDGTSCGYLLDRASRGRSFATAYMEDYIFSFPSGSPSNLSFDFKNLDPARPVIQRLSRTPGSDIVTVIFHTDLNTRAAEVIRANALKAELYAIYNDDQVTKVTLSVSDCQCCPGLLVVGGEYNNIAATTSIPGNSNSNGSVANTVIGLFTPTGYNLCYYYRDADTQYSWHNAVGSSSGSYSPRGICGTEHGVDATDAHSSWRLPHLAELAQIGQLVSNNGPGTLNSGVGSQTHVNTAISQGTAYSDGFAFPDGSQTNSTGIYNLLHNTYWSSTEREAINSWGWSFQTNTRTATMGSKTNSHYVRCVRRF
jgi:uncharacterized protein (TIGR02145 family)